MNPRATPHPHTLPDTRVAESAIARFSRCREFGNLWRGCRKHPFKHRCRGADALVWRGKLSTAGRPQRTPITSRKRPRHDDSSQLCRAGAFPYFRPMRQAWRSAVPTPDRATRFGTTATRHVHRRPPSDWVGSSLTSNHGRSGNPSGSMLPLRDECARCPRTGSLSLWRVL